MSANIFVRFNDGHSRASCKCPFLALYRALLYKVRACALSLLYICSVASTSPPRFQFASFYSLSLASFFFEEYALCLRTISIIGHLPIEIVGTEKKKKKDRMALLTTKEASARVAPPLKFQVSIQQTRYAYTRMLLASFLAE